MEYLKRYCTKTSPDMQPCPHCESCPWIGPSMSRIPCPLPDDSQMLNFQYKDVFKSTLSLVMLPTPLNDWQPQHNIKQKLRMGL